MKEAGSRQEATQRCFVQALHTHFFKCCTKVIPLLEMHRYRVKKLLTEAWRASPELSLLRGLRTAWHRVATFTWPCPPLKLSVPVTPTLPCLLSLLGWCAGEPPGPKFLGIPSLEVNTAR